MHNVQRARLARISRDPDAPELRGRRRQRVFLAGKIAHGMVVCDCTIRDLSPAGARVHVPSVIGLPDEVRLLVLREGLLVRARRIWTRETLFGLEFVEAEDIQKSRKPQAEPMRRIWQAWVAQQAKG